MYFNKHQSIKENEKKILRKVKKNWVVISLSFLTVIGTGSIISQNYIAHADSTATNNSETGSIKDSVSSQNSSETNKNNNQATNNGIDSSEAFSNVSPNSNTSSSSIVNAQSVSSNMDNVIKSTANGSLNASNANSSNSIQNNSSSTVNVDQYNDNSENTSEVYLTSAFPESSLTTYSPDIEKSISLTNVTKGAYPQYVYLQQLIYQYYNDDDGDNVDMNNFTVVKHSNGQNDVSFKPQPGSSNWYYVNDGDNLNVNTRYLYDSNGNSLMDDKLTNSGDSYEFDAANRGVDSMQVTIMSVPIVQVNYIDSNSNVVSSQYVDAPNGTIEPNKKFSLSINPPSNYDFDTVSQPSTTSNYTSDIDNSHNNENVPIATESYDPVENNDSQLSITKMLNNSALLNGTFYNIKIDQVNSDLNATREDWVINAINIPVKQHVEAPKNPQTNPSANNSNSTTPTNNVPSTNTPVTVRDTFKYMDVNNDSAPVYINGTSTSFSGAVGSTNNYSTQSVVNSLSEIGYSLTNDSPSPSNSITFKSGGNDYVFDFTHKVDHYNANSYPSNMDKADFEKAFTRTINFLDSATGKQIKNPDSQTVTYERNATYDEVTSSTSYSDWNTSNSNYPEYKAPSIDGYNSPTPASLSAQFVSINDSISVSSSIDYTKNSVNTPIVSTYSSLPVSSASTNIVFSTSNSSLASSSSATSSSETQYYEMYNYKTSLVKRNGTIHIFIQPRYTDNDTNGNLKHRDVVMFTNDNGKVTHEQEVTLNQYNAMLSASGKHTFTTEQLQQAYLKRHRKHGIMRDKTNKTTFVSPINKQGNDILIDTNGEQHGFYPTKDHYLVEDTDDLRVKISKHVNNHHSTKKQKL